MYNKQIFKRIFCYPGRLWYKNVLRVPRYFKAIRHLIKHGYDEYATWETYDWFITTMRSVLKEYKSNHYGYKILDSNISTEENEKLWDEVIDRMLSLLDSMEDHFESLDYMSDVKQAIAEEAKIRTKMDEAKNEFFSLFAEHFYDLWD